MMAAFVIDACRPNVAKLSLSIMSTHTFGSTLALHHSPTAN